MKKFITSLFNRILKYTLIGGIITAILVFSGILGVERSSFIIDLLAAFTFSFLFATPIAIIVSIFAQFSIASNKSKISPTVSKSPEQQTLDTSSKNEIEIDTAMSDIKKSVEHTAETITKNKKSVVTKTLLHLKTITDYKNFKNYIILDVETTGLDRDFDKIIEIGMLKVENGIITDRYETLVNPCIHIPSAASNVNGIYDKDVFDAPIIEDIIGTVSNFIDNFSIVGHNTNFDIAFIAREMNENGIEKHLYYYDTISICKDISLPVPNHKLETVMKYFEIKETQTHRAIDDAEVTLAVLQKCIALKLELHERSLAEKREKKKATEAIRERKYSASPLYNVGFVFTGDFENDRDDMMRDLKSVGGLVKDRVSKNSRYLVKGNIDDLPDWALERKYEKALDLSEAGGDIDIISEDEFYELIENAKLYLD